MIELVPVRRQEIERLIPMVSEYWRELDGYSENAPAPRDPEASKRLLYEALSSDEVVFWITEDDHEVGFVEYEIKTHWSQPQTRVGHIEEIYVQPGHRRTGAGRTAMMKILEEMRASDVSHVILATAVRNESARRFWEALGFKEDRIEMKLTLASKGQ